MKTESYPRKDYLTKLLPMILFLVLLGTGNFTRVLGQTTVTIGNATVSMTGGGAMYNYFNGNRVQLLYTADEIIAAGGPCSAIINQIGFNLQDIGTPNPINLTIKMQNTGSSALSSTFTTGVPVVYTNASWTPAAAGWNMFSVAPFTYTGGNLLVEVCFDNTYSYPYIYTYGTNVTVSTKSTYYYSDSDPTNVCNYASGSTTNNRSDFRFVCTPLPVLGPPGPTAFTYSNVTYNSFTYNVTPGGAGDIVVVAREGDAGFSEPSGAAPAVGDPFAGGIVIYKGASFPQTYSWSNPTGCVTKNYYVKAWGVSASNSYSCTSRQINVVTPKAALNPQSFTVVLTPTTGTTATLNGTLDNLDNPVVYVRKTTAFVAGDVPTSGSTPVVGSPLAGVAGSTVVYVGTDLPVTNPGLAENTTYYYKAWTYNSGMYSCDNGINSSPSSVTTLCQPFAPATFTSTRTGIGAVNHTWTPNAAGDGVLLVYNNTGNANFTAPTGPPPAEGSAFAGGTILYSGTSMTSHLHTGLNAVIYYYRVYSYKVVDGVYQYSCGFLTASTNLTCGFTLPYADGFESITTAGTLPACVSTNLVLGSTSGGLRTIIAPLSSGRTPHSGTKCAYFYYSPSNTAGNPATYGWVFYGPFQLSAGQNYLGGIWYNTDGYSGWRGLNLALGTSPTAAAMKVFGSAANLTNTTYAQLTANACVAADGLYWVGVGLDHSTSPLYFTIDDFSFGVNPSPPTVAPLCVTVPAPANAATAVSLTPTLSWTASAGASSYDVYFGTGASPAFVANVATTSYVPTGLSYSTTYYWQVVPKSCAGSATGCAVYSFTTGAAPTVYCASAATSTADEEIKRVKIGTINNTSGCGVGPTGPGNLLYEYSDYTALSTNLTAGGTYPMEVVQYYCGASAYGNGYSVFIDFNHDFTFDPITEKVAGSTATQTGSVGVDQLYSFNVTIPPTALTGPTRMRVLVVESNATPTACLSYSWGETEDYTVNIQPVPAKDLAVTQWVSPVSVPCGVTSVPVTIKYKNTGTAAQTVYDLAYYNGTSWTSEPVINIINPGQEFSYTFATPMAVSGLGNVNVKAKVTLASDANAANNELNAVITINPQIVVTDDPGYYQSFDDVAPHYWAAGGTAGAWALGTPTKTFLNSAYSGTKSWVTGLSANYLNGTMAWVESPCFDFTALLNPQLSLQIKYQIENKYDGAFLAYQSNGVDWIELGGLNEGGNWYTDTLKSMAGLPVWAGTSAATYSMAKHALTGLAGKSGIKLRVYFASNNTIRKEGFAFDDVRINESSELSAFVPNVSIEGAIGDTLRLKVKGGNQPWYYQWSPATGLSCTTCKRPKATPTTTTTYTVKVWDTPVANAEGGPANANGVADTVYATATVFQYPELNLSAQYSATVCDTAITQLYAIATGGVPPYSYNWASNKVGEPKAGLNLTNIYNPICDTNKTTTYHVTVTDNIGFTKTGQVTLTMVHGFPVVDVHPNPAIVCSGDSILLTATGGSTYSWSAYPSAGQIIRKPNSPSTWVIPTTSGVKFTCIVSSTCGVASSFTIVNIIPKVTPYFVVPSALPASVCVDRSPVNLVGSAMPLGGVYSGPGVSGGSFNPGAVGAGTYTITYTYTNVNGCVATAKTSISVNPLPSVAVAFPVSDFCIDSRGIILLTGGNPAGGVYSGPYVHGGYFYADSAAVGEYVITYTYTNANGCTNSNTASMHINPLPVVSVSSPAAVCVSAPAYTLNTGSPAGGTYSGVGITGGGSVYTFNPGVAGAGTHSFDYCYVDANGCDNCASSTITVYPLPTATGRLVDTAICPGSSVDYTVNFTGMAPWTVEWQIDGVDQPDFVTSDATFTFPLAPSTTTTYSFLSLTDANSCVANPFGANFTITVNPLPLKYHVVLNDSIQPYGHYCASTGGLYVGLDASQNGITYYLYRDNVLTTETFVGTGAPFWFLTPQTLDGDYTVKGVDLTKYTACENMMMNFQTIKMDVLNVDVYAQYPEICAGFTSWVKGVITNPNISNGSDYTWTWSPAGVVTAPKYDSILADPLTSTYIKLYVTDAVGCSGADSVLLTVNALPVVSIAGAPTTTICAGQPVTLTTTVAPVTGVTVTGYAWSPSAGLDLTDPSAPVAHPMSNTTYYVTVTNSKGCSQTASIVINVNPSPAIVFPNAVTSSSICSGGSFQIPLQSPGAGSYTYLWSPAASLNNATVMSPIATPAVTTTYSVTVTSTLDPYCFSVGTYTVVVDLPITVAATGPIALCNGSQANLNVNVTANGTAPFTYTWAASPAAISWIGQNTMNPTAVPASNAFTTFSVTVTDAHGCSATNSFVTSTSSIPVAYAGPNVTICEGSSTTLTGSGGPTYDWYLFGSSVSIGNTASIVVSPIATTTYELRTNSTCGPAVTNVTVTVNPKSVLAIAMSKTVFCQGDAAVNVYGSATPAGGLGSFSGNGIVNVSNDTATFTPNVAGTYDLTFTFVNTYGCTYTKTQSVTVHPRPTFVFASYAPVCASATQFTLNNATPAGGTYSGSGVSGTTFFPANVTPGDIVITYTYKNANNCTDDSTFVITVNPNPEVFNVTTDNDGHICAYSPLQGAHIYLSGSEPFLSGVKYRLYLNGTYSGIWYPATGLPIDFGPQTANGTYVVIAEYPTGCTSNMSGSVNVVIDPLPLVYTVSGGGSYCQGGAGATVHLSSTNVGVSYELYRNGAWVVTEVSPADGPFDFTGVYGDGQYTVKAINPSGCEIMMAGYAMVDELPLPTPYVVLGDNGGATVSVCVGASVTIRMYAHGEAGVSYELYFNGTPTGLVRLPGSGATLTWTSPNFLPGVYTVVGTRAPLGCTRAMLGSVTLINYYDFTSVVNPADQHIDEDQNASFTATFEGSPALTMVWQESSDGGATWTDLVDGGMYSGVNTNTLYLTSVPYGMNHYLYHLVVTGPCGFDGVSADGQLYLNPVLSVVFGEPQMQNTVNVCALGEVLVPVYVTHADSIGSISLVITFDNTHLQLLGQGPNSGGCSGAIVNCNPALSNGTVSHYSAPGSNKFSYSWFTFNPADVFANNHGTVKLFDLRFNATDAAGECFDLGFDMSSADMNVISNLNGDFLTTSYVPGQACVSPLPVITSAGVNSEEICEDYDLHFFVNAIHPDGVTYLWTGPNGFTSTEQYPVIAAATPAATGTYHVVVTSNGVGCTDEADVHAIVHPKPILATVVLPNGNNACAGSGVEVALDNSEIGTTYQLYITTYAGMSLVPAPDGIAVGTGGPITFGPMSVTGDYSVYATTMYGCGRWMTGSVHVQINPLPLWFNVIGGGHYCIGGNGKEIKLSGSQIGVQYTLLLNACCCQADSILMTVIGTGSPISFGYHMTPGYYSVVAVNPNTPSHCQNNMVGCVPIVIEPLPTAVLGGVTNVCSGLCGNLTLTMTGKAPFDVAITDGTTSFVVHAMVSPWSFEVCPTATTTYTIVGITDANGCENTGSGSGTVNVWDLPVVTVANTSPVCVGGTVNLSSTVSGFGTVSYVWTGPNFFASTDENPVIANVTEANAGIYSLTVTDGHGCVNTAHTTVVVNPLPVVTATGSATCFGGRLELNVYVAGQGTYGFVWSGPNGFTSTEQNPFISPAGTADAGTYTVVVTDANGCTNSATAELVVYELPTISCGSNSAVCVGQTINLISSAAGFGTLGYSWTGPNGFMSSEQNPTIANATADNAGDYVVTVYDGHQCVASCTTNVVVNQLPTPCTLNVTDPNVYCFGCIPPVIWLACSEANVSYTLYLNDVATSKVVVGDGDSISFGYGVFAGWYKVYAVNSLTGCSNWMIDSVEVIQQAPPTATIYGDTICVGEVPSMRIDLTGDDHWHVVITDGVHVDTISSTVTPIYYTPGTGAHILAPTGTTTYTISLVVDRVCYNVGNAATLIINSLPNKYTLVGGGYYCNGIGVNVGLNGSQIGIQYVLMSNGVIMASVVGTGSAISFGPQTTGLYTAYAVNPVSGCTNDMNGEVVVQPDPGLDGFTVTGGGHYCFGQPGVSIYLSGSQAGIEYKLLKGNIYTGQSITGTGYALLFGNIVDPGTYTVLAFDPISTCTRNMTGSSVVVMDPLPTATISGNATICYGESATLHVVLTGTAPWTLIINDGVNTKVHHILTSTYDSIVTPASTTTYYISAVIDNNCQNVGSGSATVTVNSPTQFVVTGGGTYCSGGAGVVISLAGSQTGVNYELFHNGITTGTILAGTGSPLDFGAQTLPGQYTVVATSTVNGCVRNMAGVAVIVISQLPWAYNVTGGGECCVGCSHVVVCLDGSQYGVVYELYINGASSGILRYGNGTEICWPYATVAGIYTIKGTDMQTGCWSWMAGSATVTLWPTAQANIVGGGNICAGGCADITVSFTTGAAPFSFGLSANGGAPVVYSNIMTSPYTVTVCPTSSTSYTLAWVSDVHGCYNNQTTGVAMVNVTQIPGVYLPQYPAVCIDAPAFELYGAVPPGGSFSGVGVDNGWFYPSVAGAGSHVISYTYSNVNGCLGFASTTIVVNPLPVVEFTGLALSYCIDAQPALIVGNHAPYGTFTGTGIYDNGNGTATFSPTVAGMGAHVVTYTFTDVNGCSSSITATTEVLALPTVSIANLNGIYCLNSPAVTLTGIPAGGVFSGAGMTGDVFSPALAGVGTHSITYTYSSSNFCSSSFTATVTVLPLPDVCSFNGGGFCCVGCSVPAILTCSQIGYSYQLVRNGQQNVGLPVMGTGSALLWEIFIGGTYTIVATSPVTGCSVTMNNNVVVEIIPQPVAMTSGSSSLCEGQCATVSVTLSGFPPFTILFTNGTDTISVNGIMDFAWDTVVCPTVSTTYAVSSVQDMYCGNNGAGSAAIIVNPAPPVFNVTGGGTTCVNGNGVAVGLSGSVNGLHYELFLEGASTGVVVVGTGGPITFGTYSVPGLFTVHSMSATTCEYMMNGYAEVIVTPLPSVTLDPIANVCHNAAPFTLVGGAPVGGYYTINGVPASSFDASTLVPGNAVVGYVYTDGVGCSNVATQTVVVYPLPTVTLATISDVCFTANAFAFNGGAPAGGTYYIGGLPVTSFDPAAAGVGTYTVMYMYTDGNGCSNSASRTFAVRALPNVTLAQFAGACLGGDPIVLTGGSPVGGVYSGQGVVSGVFTPDALGTFAVTYTYTDAFGCTKAATQDIIVTSCAVYTIAGNVNYDNTANTVMTNTTVYLKQGSATIATTTTDANGHYEFIGLIPGNYSVSASSTKPWGGVNSNDALLIMKHFANINLLSGLRLAAADVNGDHAVNSIDALLAAKRFVNQINGFSVGDWVFQVNTVTISNANVTNDFKALCFGDVNGSHSPSLVKVAPTVNLNVAGIKEVKSFERFELPVSVVGNLKVGAISLVLSYPENLYDVEGVQLRNLASSELIYTAINGELRISWYNNREINLSDNDVLVTLQLRAKNLSNASNGELAIVLDGISEIGDKNAAVIMNVNLNYPKLAIASSEYSISNYPNPFNTVTEITYSMPEAGNVTLRVYNILGDEVAVLVNNVAQTANTYTVQFDASNLVAGVYTYKIEVKGESKDFVKSGKMVMTK